MKSLSKCSHTDKEYIRIVFTDKEYHLCLKCFKKYTFEGVKKIEYIEK